MNRNGRLATPATVAPSAEPVPAVVRQEGPLATGERFRPFALAALDSCTDRAVRASGGAIPACDHLGLSRWP